MQRDAALTGARMSCGLRPGRQRQRSCIDSVRICGPGVVEHRDRRVGGSTQLGAPGRPLGLPLRPVPGHTLFTMAGHQEALYQVRAVIGQC